VTKAPTSKTKSDRAERLWVTLTLAGISGFAAEVLLLEVLPSLGFSKIGQISGPAGAILGLIIALLLSGVLVFMRRRDIAAASKIGIASDPSSRLRASYVCGFLLVACLIVFSQNLVRSRVANTLVEDLQTRIISSQRHNCQQLVRSAASLVNATAAVQREAAMRVLSPRLEAFRLGSGTMDTISRSLNATNVTAPILDAAIAESNRFRHVVITLAEQLSSLSPTDAFDGQRNDLLAQLLHAHADYEDSIDHAASELNNISRASSIRTVTETRDLSLAVLISLAIVACVVMEPAVRGVSRKHREMVNQRHELERVALVAEHTRNAVILCDKLQQILWVNPGFEQMSGYAAQEALGRSPYALLEKRMEQEDAADYITVALAAGEVCRAEVINRGKSGREYWADMEVQPIKNAAGEVTGFMIIETETTEQVTLRQSLKSSEERVRTVVDTALDAVIGLDSCGKVTLWNAQAEKTFGYAAGEAYGMAFSEIALDAEQRIGFNNLIAAYSRGEIREHFEARSEFIATDRNGRRFPAEQSISPHREGKKVTYSLFIRDITERKAAQEAIERARDEAQAANRSKSDFLANMSHEIRTPMTAMLGYTDLLAEQGDRSLSPKERLEYIDTIKRNGHHLLSIINDILDIAKIEADKMTVERIPFSPAAIGDEVAELFKAKAQASGIELHVETRGPMPATILGDPLRFRQVLTNLTGNAVKFTEQGSVTLEWGLDTTTDATNAMLTVSVRDTGVGMSPEQVSRLFRPFEQADSSMTRRFGGTGLGLRISKRLAELMGGSLTAASEEGRGSVFTFETPAGPVATLEYTTEKATPVKAAAAEAVSLKGLRILLMEDGIDNQRLIMFHLRKAGAEVTIADNGRIGVEMLSSDGTLMGSLKKPVEFDVILSDMQMPELDGYSAIAWLRSRGLRIPIIAVTAHAMAGDDQRCIDAGCDGYATKPIDRAKLIGICRDAADGKLSRVAHAAT
jgi:PAS domain S-box-containing protein